MAVLDLRHADLTYCNLKNAFIGINDEDATEQKTLDKEQKALVCGSLRGRERRCGGGRKKTFK